MKKKKFLIFVLVLLMLITSFFVLTKKPKIKYKKLKELNYNLTYKQAFPDENLRRGVLLCIMRNKCGATEANNSIYENYYYHLKSGEPYYEKNYFSTKDYITSNYGTAITESDLITKENETISKVDLERLEVLLTNDYKENINSLQGIEYLSNIKVAVLPKVEQENVDFSYNKELLRLYLNTEKLNGTSIIKTVNLDQNTKLKELELRLDKNIAHNLNLSHLTSLELLNIYQSQAKNVVLPNNIKTVELEANGIENITLPNGIINVDLDDNKIKNIVIPSSVRKLSLYSNLLSNITLPNGIEEVILVNNKLTSLVVPSSVKKLSATTNKISNVQLQPGIKELALSENELTNITLPEGVEEVYLIKNKLTNLVIPSSVKEINASFNLLNNITVPSGVETLNLSSNKISNITLSETLKSVYLSYNNLTNINLNNGINIEGLNLNKNPLKNINVTKLLKLKYLDLTETKLESNIDLKNNVELKSFSISGKEEGEEPLVENFNFSSNLNIKELSIGDRNLKNFDLGKYHNLKYLKLENNIMNPNLDLSNLTELKNLNLSENKLTNIKVTNDLISKENSAYLSGKETIKLKVKKNSYVTIPKVYFNDKEIYLPNKTTGSWNEPDDFYLTRNGETYRFKVKGNFIFQAVGIHIPYKNRYLRWEYEIKVENGEEHTFNPVFDQGNYTPLINEEITVNNLKEMITNLPANIKNFEIISANTFAEKGDKTIKVRITFSDDTFKEVDVPIKVYEKEDILPTVTVTPETLEVIDKKPVNVNITRSYAKEDNIDNTNFIKTVRDNLVSYEYLNKASGLTYNSNSVTGVIDYLFTGTEEEHIFNITYKEQGNIYRVNKNITIKLLRDTDKDGTPDKDDDDKDGDGFSNAVEIARGSDPYDKTSLPDMSKKDELDNLIKQLEKLIEDTKNNPFDNKNKLDVDKLKNNFLPVKVTEKDNIKASYSATTSDTDLLKLIEKVKEIKDDIKKEINKLRDKANFEELEKEIAKEIDEDFYLEDTVKVLKDKIKEAKDLDRNTATQEEVDKLTKDIKDLRDKLVINKSKLKDKIKDLEEVLDSGKYNEEEFQKLLKQAKDLYNKDSFTKKEMLDIIENIDNLLNRKGSLLNPNTGIKTYSLVILLIILISYLVFKKKKNYIR